MRRSLAGALLALMLAAALICPAWGEDFRPLLENRPLTAGDSVSDWLVASGRAGLQRPDYLRDLESYVTSMYRENGGLDRIKATEWHRITLAVLAQGGDPTAFGRDREGKPIDLVAEGTYNWSRSRSLGAQGLNGWIFALITLDSGGFAVPEGAAYTREDMRRAILAAQTEEGAFGLSAGTADVDITAMALQALAPYQEDAATAEAIRRGLAWLSGQQTENGDFVSWGDPNAESTAQVLIALCSLGLDPETDPRFIRNGRTLRDGLLSYRTREGLFRHTAEGPEDLMATEQAILALQALDRLRAGQGRLYDLRDIPPAASASASPLPWLIAGAAVLAAAGIVIIVIRKRKRVCTK